jgi:bifunctional ADP-heptose synthase (sugar kinase/adenylyltransferase)
VNTHAILKSIQSVQVLCTGDLWLDRWSQHDPFLSTPSPETGLASTVLVATENAAGGCGLAAAAAAALGAEVTVLGVVGDDGSGMDLRRALEQAGVQRMRLIAGQSPTPVTTRLINSRTGAEDAGRIEIVQFQQSEAVALEFQADLRRLSPLAQCVIAVDAKPAALGGLIGTAGRAVLAEIAALAPFVWLDSAAGFEQVRGVGRPSLILRPDGQGGIGIEDGPARQTVPETSPEHPVDPHGARETFSTAAALALAAGTEAAKAVRFALLAAAVCMMKPGARCASPEEILRAERELSE